LRSLLAVAIVQLTIGTAHACSFARNAEPNGWYEWASTLFAGSVTGVEQDRQGALDVISVRVVETFKGPAGDVATLSFPSRIWATCGLSVPAVGADVLVGLDARGNSALVPLAATHAAILRDLALRKMP
jgi:hypothetical protein